MIWLLLATGLWLQAQDSAKVCAACHTDPFEDLQKHKHFAKSITCETCHGPIQEMDVVRQHSLLTMGWCIDCHRTTQVNAQGNAYYDKLMEVHEGSGKAGMTVEDIGGLECSKCHY